MVTYYSFKLLDHILIVDITVLEMHLNNIEQSHIKVDIIIIIFLIPAYTEFLNFYSLSQIYTKMK